MTPKTPKKNGWNLSLTSRFLTPSPHFPRRLHIRRPQDCAYNEGRHFCLCLQFTSFLHPGTGNTRLLVRSRKSLCSVREKLAGAKTEAPLGELEELEELPLEKKVADVVAAAGWKFPGNFVSLLLLI